MSDPIDEIINGVAHVFGARQRIESQFLEVDHDDAPRMRPAEKASLWVLCAASVWAKDRVIFLGQIIVGLLEDVQGSLDCVVLDTSKLIYKV